MFGLGMTLVGTCGFGLLVRAGGGDLRAAASAVVVGVFAMAVTAGLLAPLRIWLIELDVIDLTSTGGVSLVAMAQKLAGKWLSIVVIAALISMLLLAPFLDRRLRQRPRLLIGSILMGLSITAGWFATSRAMDALALDRPESLSFVAPVGRALLQLMMEPFRNVGFGVAAMFGVLTASLAVAIWRAELRWEAFDDATEMRRHVLGGALMGVGGVLAQGCTIGQGMSAASTLTITAPIFIACVIAGAKLGLLHLIEGRSLWRLGRSQRTD
ncbi:MAG: YeeE/YedE family protein, partial [Hyphomicrobiaceae bacterium]